MAELADAHDSKSCTYGYEGSIPSFGIKKSSLIYEDFVFLTCLEVRHGDTLAAFRPAAGFKTADMRIGAEGFAH